jgi:diacylglycerol O-acyltransferase
VALQFPVSERTESDTRANALTGMTVIADPAEVITSLTTIRSDLKTGLKEVAGTQHKLLAPLPLAPVTPKRLLKSLEGVASADGPVVGCSNMGEVPAVLAQLDGTDPEFVLARGVEWPVGPGELDRIGNWLLVGSARLGGKVLLFITAWQVGSTNSKDDLADVVGRGLADFGLSASFVGR